MDQPGRRISTVSKAHDMRVAVVHDWLVDYGGAERVLEEILTLFPDADLFTLIDCPPADRRAFIENRKITTSFLQKFPFPDKLYRKYLAFMPLAVEQFDLSEYDIVISSSHAVAKGVLTHGDQVHISYFNGLMNYAWGQYHFYLKDAGLDRGLKGLLAKLILHRIRLWDVAAANRVDRYIANSASMANDIKRIYGRTSTVIYARAFSMMPAKKLVIIGDGPEMDRIKAVSGDNVHFHGARRREVVAAHMAKARALITASTEPFGIASVEAQACGTPVIAYGKGGALETIINNETGLFFYRQRPEEIVKAVNRFESPDCDFDPRVIRNNALRFSRENFRKNFKAFVEKSIAGESRSGPMVLRRGKERAPMSSPSGERELISELISTD
jgi:glycosyltransferase involved in cell wall biosynthesis